MCAVFFFFLPSLRYLPFVFIQRAVYFFKDGRIDIDNTSFDVVVVNRYCGYIECDFTENSQKISIFNSFDKNFKFKSSFDLYKTWNKVETIGRNVDTEWQTTTENYEQNARAIGHTIFADTFVDEW